MKRIFLFTLVFFFILIGSLVFFVFYAASPAERMSLFGLVKYDHIAERADRFDHAIRLVTYNIGYASGDQNNKGAILKQQKVLDHLDAMVAAIGKFSPDVVAMQEVDFKAWRTFNINQLDYLAHGLGLPYSAYAVTWNKRYVPWPYWPPHLHFGPVVSGQAILSRYPLKDYEVRYFDKPAENPFWYNLFYLDRVAQKVRVNIGGKSMTVWNVHLEAFDSVARLKQARLLSEMVEGEEGDQFVLGDFNSVSVVRENLSEKNTNEESSEALRFFLDKTKFNNAESDKTFYTMPSWDPARKIDHITYSTGLNMKSVETIPDLKASDHLPVLAEFLTP